VECLARLAAIVRSPRYPLLRIHGIHSPNHVVRVKWRHRKPLGAAHWAAPDL
jgi:hypothetical protein